MLVSSIVLLLGCVALCDAKVVRKRNKPQPMPETSLRSKLATHGAVAAAVGISGAFVHQSRMRGHEAKYRQEQGGEHDTQKQLYRQIADLNRQIVELTDAIAGHKVAYARATSSANSAIADKMTMYSNLKRVEQQNTSLHKTVDQITALNKEARQQVTYWRTEARAAEDKYEKGWRKRLMTITEDRAAETASAVDDSIARIESLERQTYALKKTLPKTWKPLIPGPL